jgi:hypothetical protein
VKAGENSIRRRRGRRRMKIRKRRGRRIMKS